MPKVDVSRLGQWVLLVEDNEINRNYVCELLTVLGCSVHIACNGQEAVQKFLPGHYALVLMDCQMPVMDGFEATRQIRAKEAERPSLHVPILALTAKATGSDLDHCLESGMDSYLVKPFRPDEFFDKVRLLTGIGA